MSLDVLQACVRGYSNRLLDQQIVAVQTGHWTAYYLGTKRPKSMQDLAKMLYNNHKKQSESSSRVRVARPDVDVDAFLQQEALFKAKWAQEVGEPSA